MHTLNQLLSGELRETKRLKIATGLTEFPQEIFTLADTLEILDLTDNNISQLPADFGRLYKLKIVFFSNNAFERFPEVLAQCPDLEMIGFKANKIAVVPEGALPSKTRWLILTDNRITVLPKSIGLCHRMQKLMLAGNRLQELPVELSACENLELLRISANRFEVLPQWLFSLPKLSWLAIAGNPCTQILSSENSIQYIPWNELLLQKTLGEGASGVISMALWKSKEQAVAVKVYKGAVTSDGLPDDEINICIAAGRHEHLVPILGRIMGHPLQKQGLVMELISSSYITLGLAPTFDTCTRDVYPPHLAFTYTEILSILSGVADVVGYLHQRGIMHGDLYAHNIQINNRCVPILGDFGAATRYERTHGMDSIHPLESIEVRAFGCLIEDLLGLADNNADEVVRSSLTILKQACMRTDVGLRPSFEDIRAQLQLLKAMLV